MGAKIETDMRKDLFDHLQEQSYSYFDNTKIGQIMARITSDLFDITEFAHHCPEEYFIAALKISIAFAILAQTDLTLTLIIFSLIPVMLICAMSFNDKMRQAFKRSRNQIGELNAQVEDSLLGVRVVKSFANEGVEREKFRKGNEGFLKIKREAYRYMAGFHSTIRFFDGVMYIAVVVIGAIFMVYGRIGAPDLVAYLLYVSMLLASVRRIVEFTEQFQRGMTGIERFLEIMDSPIEVEDAEDAVPLPPVKGEIRFDKVSFRYSDNNKNVLSNIDLTVAAGEHVALVGRRAAGRPPCAT
jgi:ATP-binding cassette subfamily B protein